MRDEAWKRIKWLTVRILDRLCQAVDEVAYRPAVVKLTLRLPRWWSCDLARLSVWLDERWKTGRWSDGGQPDRLCRACGRRAAWLDIFWEEEGVTDVDEPDDPDPVFHPTGGPVPICGWCHRGRPDGLPITSDEELERALLLARRESISWRWRWRLP
jgi:hypothetical protein